VSGPAWVDERLRFTAGPSLGAEKRMIADGQGGPDDSKG